MEKELKDWTFKELVDFWYGHLIMNLASAEAPKSVMWRALDTAIRWHIETQATKSNKNTQSNGRRR